NSEPPTSLRVSGSELDTINFSQFAKVDLDYRFYKKLSSKHNIATRINIGIARPFGFTSDVPYVKQFFVGGPTSIRAWAARELGPGGYDDPALDEINNPLFFYQTGDLKLEFNFEYRFDLFWSLKGALFLDGGNVWTLDCDPTRLGSQFLLRSGTPSCATNGNETFVNEAFYQQIALGSGFGLRLDFAYFILRLDMGLRVRNPFREPTTNRYWVSPSESFQNINFNLGLGYPF
ncbi:MAG: BamA/TamA family outer membrane protein, partial [Bacteroidota bacterium]